MKFYVSSRKSKINEVREIYKKLEELGHEIILDWTKNSLTKPYSKNKNLAEKFSNEVIEAILESDIFLLIGDKDGTDMYGELASAITSQKIKEKPKIYYLGEKSKNSIFPFHKYVNYKNSLEEVLKDLKKN